MFMEIKSIPYDVWYDLDRIRRTNEEIDKRFVGYHSDFYNKLVDFGYIEIEETNDNYNFYKALPKFDDTKDANILEEICGKSIKEIMVMKVIEGEDVPDDLDELLETLKETDGYFDKVNIYDVKLSNILRFYGFTVGAGVNGSHSAGSEKLRNSSLEKVIETITGMSVKSVEEAKTNSKKGEEIALMRELAEKYGYEVMKTEDYVELLG